MKKIVISLVGIVFGIACMVLGSLWLNKSIREAEAASIIEGMVLVEERDDGSNVYKVEDANGREWTLVVYEGV